MHCLVRVFTKTKPTNEELSAIMEPYCEYGEGVSLRNSEFVWDGYQVGGRYDGALEVNLAKCKDFDSMDEYTPANSGSVFLPCVSANGSYYHALSDKCIQENMDDAEDPRCFVFISPEGLVLAKESWNGTEWVDKRTQFKYMHGAMWYRFEKEDLYLTTVDIHH